ncbi:sulfatase-like hydrolase/transferase [Acidobacteria bacterium AH-259-O06]|nr:sulfatase-like hydrolase/transferase [Acidobacteria bacterium AH-259-O06]
MSKRKGPPRRDFLKTMAVGAASLTLTGCVNASQRSAWKQGKQPNVLFIFNDQHRTEACSVYGGRNVQTPNIDRLASQGMRFTNALSTCPLCTPYRGMLQTGRYPMHSGIVANFVETNPNQRCLAHVFREAGYLTGFIGKWHLSAGALKRNGKFDVNVAANNAYKRENPDPEFTSPGPKRLGYEHWETYNFHMDFRKGWYYRDEPKKLFYSGYETDGQTDQAIEFMKKNKDSDRPFFLMVAPHPPHPLWRGVKDVPKEYLDRIGQDIYLPPNAPKHYPLGPLQGPPAPHNSLSRRQIRTYYAMCRNFDDNLDRLMKYLDESGLAEDTIIIYTSDHGEQLGSHNRRSKMVPYAESVDVPLIFRWPGRIRAGATSDVLYTPVDHMATLCKLAGLEVPDTCDGRDLSPVVLGKGSVDRDAALMAHYVSTPNFFQSGTDFPEWRACRTKQYTYVKWLTAKEELYENAADPYQMNNLAEGQKVLPLLQKMRARLKDLLADAHDDFLPGTAYADWYDDQRNLIGNALGPI